MVALNGMETYASRLASFSIAQPLKKRGSDARGAKSVRWPHENPKIEQLATAGFFYKPSAASADNVRCFLCSRDMDGWEEDDNPVIEHLKHSPDCGWAINMGIEQQVNDKLKDPSSQEMLDARKMTFGVNWPHEHKRGWICKTQKLIESGWYYCPTPESDDFVKCSYCDLGLDGWEPKDNPYDEHLRRSPDCPLLRFASMKPKVGRPRKNSRASKVSRVSSVSIGSAVSEGLSAVVLELNESELLDLPSRESEEPVKPGKGAKKGGKAKKASAKPKKTAKTTKTEDSVMTESVMELETEKFAVHAEKTQPKSGRSKKRNSDQMNEGNDDMLEEIQSQYPTAKRRATKTRSNAVQPSVRVSVDTHDFEVEMTDVESMPPPPPPVSKKGGKKRAPATTRKASAGSRKASESMRNPSTTSTASVASLRAPAPDDDDIDAALEADLDRPFTDDEMEDQKSEVVYPRIEKVKMRRSEIEDLVYPQLKKVEIPQHPPEQHETQDEAQQEIEQDIDPEAEPEAEPEIEPEIELGPEPEIELGPEPEIEQHEFQEAEIDIEQVEVPQPDVQTPSRPRSSRAIPSTKKSTPAPKRRSPRGLPITETRNDSGSDKENDSSQMELHLDSWTPVDIGMFFAGSPAGELENDDPLAAFGSMVIESLNEPLPSPEKVMTIEQWIQHKAKQAEDRLRNQCERLVGKFESEGMRALGTLEGLTCVD